MENREAARLRARFVFLGRVIAWECERCRKMFSITPEEALANPGSGAPETVLAEFHQHDCGVVAVARLIERNPALEYALRSPGDLSNGRSGER